MLWKNEGGCRVTDSGNHFIDFEVENEEVGRWRYTGFYGCPERGQRWESWEMIRNLATKSNLPWCTIGDFNNLMFTDDKKGGRNHPINLLQGFVETITNCDLMDLGYVGEKFTLEKSRGKYNWVQEMLNNGFTTQDWRNLFPSAEVKVLEVATSDHFPLYLQLNKQVYKQKER